MSTSTSKSTTAEYKKKTLVARPIPTLAKHPNNWQDWINALTANFSECKYIPLVLKLKSSPKDVGLFAIAEALIQQYEDQQLFATFKLPQQEVNFDVVDDDMEADMRGGLNTAFTSAASTFANMGARLNDRIASARLPFSADTPIIQGEPNMPEFRTARAAPPARAPPSRVMQQLELAETVDVIKSLVAKGNEDALGRFLSKLMIGLSITSADLKQMSPIAAAARHSFKRDCALVIQTIFNKKSVSATLETQLRATMSLPSLEDAMEKQDLGAVIQGLFRLCIPSVTGISHDFLNVIMQAWNPGKSDIFEFLENLNVNFRRIRELTKGPPSWDELQVSVAVVNLNRDPRYHAFTQPMITESKIPTTPEELVNKFLEFVNASDLIEAHNKKTRGGGQQSSTFAVQSTSKGAAKKKPTCHFCL